jgi:hypothetical protein
MDIAIRKRLAIALASKGLNMERVSLAACLSQTYAHDVIKRRRERSLHLEILCERLGISWEWLRFGKGEMETPEKRIPQPQAPVQSQAPAPPANIIHRIRLVAAMEASYQLIGAKDSQASTLAALVLSVAQGRKAHGTASAPQANVIDRTRFVAAMEASYRLLGAPDSQASTLAALVLSVAQGRKAPDTGGASEDQSHDLPGLLIHLSDRE